MTVCTHVYYLCFIPADIGYAYGNLLSEEISYAYNALLKTLIGDKWYDEVSS